MEVVPKHPFKSETMCRISKSYCVLRREVVSPSHNPLAAVPPLVGCQRLFIEYNRSYPTCPEDRCSERVV